MNDPRNAVGRLGLASGVVWASLTCGGASAQQEQVTAAVPIKSSLWVSVDGMPVHVRDGVQRVLERPTVQARGPVEIFRGNVALYHWMMDHPDRGVQVWRRMGAKCMEIADRGNGRFGWTDGQGSGIQWETVSSGPAMRIWYAEGQARPGPLVPLIPARAVAILRFAQSKDALGRTIIRHQAEIYLQTDSKAAALIAQIMGGSAQQLARHCAAQMALFFSGPVAVLDKYPDRMGELLLQGTTQETLDDLRRALDKGATGSETKQAGGD